MRWRVAGVLLRPRVAMADLTARPAWAGPWLFILLVWALCGFWLLSTPVGRQALVDERVRSVEAFGGAIDDAEYAALQQSPPVWVYFTSGGRLLLSPPVTLVTALILWWSCAPSATPSQALAVSVHASSALALGQVIATPLSFIRESLTSPFTVGGLLRIGQEGTLIGHLFGAIDVFAVWWLVLLAIGAATLARQSAGRFLLRAFGVYLGIAALLAAMQVAAGS